MATIAEVLKLVACGAVDLKGTGLKFCKFNFKQPRVLVFWEKGFKFAPDDTFDLAAIQLAQQKGKAIVLSQVTDFTDNTPDNDRRTFASTGVMTPTLRHPYQWMYTFDNGLDFFMATVLLASSNAYDFGMFDVAGNYLGAKDKEGNLRGLPLEMLDSGKYVIGNENSESLTVQINRQGFDTQVAWIEADQIPFVADQDLDGYNDVTIEWDAAPTDGATTLDFTIYAGDSAKKVYLDGLVAADMLLEKTVSGVTSTVTKTMATRSGAGQYRYTVSAVAEGEIYATQTYDAAVPSAIINIDGPLYKSNKPTTVVLP